MCFSKLQVGTQGIKYATRQTSGQPSHPMVTLYIYIYVWTYNPTRQMHIPVHIQTGPCYPKQNTKISYPPLPKETLTSLHSGPLPSGNHGRGWVVLV